MTLLDSCAVRRKDAAAPVPGIIVWCVNALIFCKVGWFFFLLLTWNYRIQLLPILMASALSAYMHLLLNACVSRTQLCFSTITNKRHYRLIVCVKFRKPCSATVFEMSLGAFGLQLCVKRISLMIAINWRCIQRMIDQRRLTPGY